MDRFNFILEWYYKEFDRRESLNGALTIPIGIITGLLTTIFFICKEFDYQIASNKIILYLFIGLLVYSILNLFHVAFYLFKSYNNFFKGYLYGRLPSVSELDKQYSIIQEYYNQYEKELAPDQSAISIYENQIIELLEECIDINIDHNSHRSELLFKAKKLIIKSVIPIIICSIIYVFNYVKSNNIDDNIPKSVIEETITTNSLET